MKWQTRFIYWLVGEYLDSRPVSAVHQDPPPAPAPVVTAPAVVSLEARRPEWGACGACACWLYSEEKGYGTCHRGSPWHVNVEQRNKPRGVWLITGSEDGCFEHVRRQ